MCGRLRPAAGPVSVPVRGFGRLAPPALLFLLVATGAAGCAAHGGKGDSGGSGSASRSAHSSSAAKSSSSSVLPSEVRTRAMAVADSYTTLVAQACDDLRAKTTRPEVARWATELKIAT